MKTLLFITAILFISYSGAQDETNPGSFRNELKLNALYLVEGTFEITYERLVSERAGVGISTYVVLREGGMKFFGDDLPWNFSLTPFARIYFGNPRAKGFFIEGNLMLGADSQALPDTGYREETAWGVGAGMAYGAKWHLPRSWVIEAYVGIGFTNLWDTPDEGGGLFGDWDWDWFFYPRFGATIGKRF